MRRGLMGLLLAAVLAASGGALVINRRLEQCQAVPLLAGDILPNPALSPDSSAGLMPRGWGRGASGVELQGAAVTPGRGFDLDGDGRALQLIGIANYVETPPIPVRAGRAYCFTGRALTDSPKGSATRARLEFRWQDAAGRLIAADTGAWQPVQLWRQEAPPRDWSALRAAFAAPAGAASLVVRIQPASDDRIYLDAMHARWTSAADQSAAQKPTASAEGPAAPLVQPWPQGYQGALSFSFDWETAMGGLVHSRSVGDPYSDQDPPLRGMRMRQGVTTTLELFEPRGIRATYYATGYNFLDGNPQRRRFMGDPVFAWATPEHGWRADWRTRPWFADDPYGSVASAPAWYFGDLTERLRRAGQDIQSHTFSHLDGGLASAAQWQADIEAWRDAAAARGLPPARSLAFPWSSSAGMSDSDWLLLEQAGVRSVTRTNRSQAQYQLVSYQRPHCSPVPGHERILACPDYYLTTASEITATALIDRAIAQGGMIDLWAHTEEVTTAEQIAAWGRVVAHAAAQRDAGALWIAPLAEIAGWQQSLDAVRVVPDQRPAADGRPLSVRIVNGNQHALNGLTLKLPFQAARAELPHPFIQPTLRQPDLVVLDLPAQQTLELTLWPR